MGFCKRKGVDCECLTDHSTCNSDNCHKKLPDVNKKRLEGDKVMTFKEKLVEQADNYENVSIQEDMDFIKSEMEKCAYNRELTIYLIKPYTAMAIGRSISGCISLFIPEGIHPVTYRQKFIDALLELGFTDKDISTTEEHHAGSYDGYNLHINW